MLKHRLTCKLHVFYGSMWWSCSTFDHAYTYLMFLMFFVIPTNSPLSFMCFIWSLSPQLPFKHFLYITENYLFMMRSNFVIAGFNQISLILSWNLQSCLLICALAFCLFFYYYYSPNAMLIFHARINEFKDKYNLIIEMKKFCM